jgi:tetratricopeptide (TPR) repeat protein
MRHRCGHHGYLIAALGALVFSLCTPPRFPVVRPVGEIERDQKERAEAEACFIAARDFERRGDFHDAARYYARAYDCDPQSKELRDQVVRCYMSSGKYLQALALVKRKEKVRPLDAEERRMIAGIYLKMGEMSRAVEAIENIADKEVPDYYTLAIMYESMGNVEKALHYYRAYYRYDDASLGLGLKIVRMQLARKQFDSAESLAAALQRRHGEKPELYDLCGVVALTRNDTAAALDFFNRAVAVDSAYEDAARNAAQVYVQKNDYRRAIPYYEMLYRKSGLYKDEYGRLLAMLYYYDKRLVEAANLTMELLHTFFDDADLHYNLGLICSAMGKNDQARIELEKALVLRGDYGEAWRELFSLAVRERNYDRAYEVAGRWCARSPQEGAAWRCEGYALSLKKEYDRAVPCFLRAVALDSVDAGAWFELGSCYERNRDIPHAADAFRRVLRLNPGDPAASNYLGYMWAEKGMALDSAKVLLESALSKEPYNGAFLDSYAWILYQQGAVESAYEYMVKAVCRIHNDPVVFEHLGDLLDKRNDWEAAVKAYRRSLEYNPDNADLVRQKIVDLDAVQYRSGGR